MIDIARSDTLWSAQDAAAATAARPQGVADWQAGGVSIDTRTLQRGDLFVALHGASDGHRFEATIPPFMLAMPRVLH